jgi:hypothetical protein
MTAQIGAPSGDTNIKLYYGGHFKTDTNPVDCHPVAVGHSIQYRLRCKSSTIVGDFVMGAIGGRLQTSRIGDHTLCMVGWFYAAHSSMERRDRLHLVHVQMMDSTLTLCCAVSAQAQWTLCADPV